MSGDIGQDDIAPNEPAGQGGKDHARGGATRRGEYLLHDAMVYSQWNPGNDVSANITHAKTVDNLRRTSSSHVILTVDEATRRVANGEVVNIAPLCGGIPPDIAWRYLQRFAAIAVTAGVGH